MINDEMRLFVNGFDLSLLLILLTIKMEMVISFFEIIHKATRQILVPVK